MTADVYETRGEQTAVARTCSTVATLSPRRVETFRADDDTPDSLESAAGFALATAFGCGARHGLDALIDVLTGGVGST